jgi:hypothetical protein
MKQLIIDIFGVSFASVGVLANLDNAKAAVLFLGGVVFFALRIQSLILDIKKKKLLLKEAEEEYDEKHKKT